MFGKIIGVFYSPALIFERLDEKENVWFPFMFLLGISIIISLLYVNFVVFPFRENILAQREIPPEAMEQARRFMSRPFMNISTLVSTLIGLPLIIVLISAIFYFGIQIFGGVPNFSQTFLYVVYSWFIQVLGNLLRFPIALIKKSPEVHTDLTLFLPFLSKKNFLFSFFSHWDIFVLWSLYAMVCGMSVTSKVSKKTAFIFIYTLWFIFAFIFSLFSLFRFRG